MFCGMGHRVGCTCVTCGSIRIDPRSGKRASHQPRHNKRMRESSNMALSKPLPGQYNGPKEVPFLDSAFASEFPTIFEYLTSRQWADGSPRVTSTLLVFLENGVLRICINDRENVRSAFITAPTFGEALASLEAKLCGETLEWRFKNQRTPSGATPPW